MSLQVRSSSPESHSPSLFGQILQRLKEAPAQLQNVASAALALGLDQIAPAHHDMRSHTFNPGQCVGGRLTYQGDIPVLSLESDDPSIAGRAQGYLCGNAIHALAGRFDTVIHMFDRQPKAKDLPKTIAAFRRVVSPEYWREMEGVVEGYRNWAREHRIVPVQMTADDLLLTYLLPEQFHFEPAGFEGKKPAKAPPRRGVACSVVVDKDPQKGFVFARNLDWASLRMAGSHSLVVHRKHANGLHDTVDVALPGMIGTLTGMNRHGLSLAMNVCSGETDEVRGMPATLFNRACLERCKTVKEAEEFVQSHRPLGSYHLSAADQQEACSFHFYQSPRGTDVIRRWTARKPLVTLNFRYSPRPNSNLMKGDERQRNISEFFRRREGRPLEETLSLEEVNNEQTIHRIVMEPKTRTLKVAFDDAFAGSQPLQTVEVFTAPGGSKDDPIVL